MKQCKCSRNALHQSVAALLTCAVGLVGCSKPKQPAQPLVPEPAYFRVDAATAGSVSGVVAFHGAHPLSKPIDMRSDPACVGTHKGVKVADQTLRIDKQGNLADSFVYVSHGLEGKQFARPATVTKIDQAGCMFQPHVLGIQTGGTLDIVNSDPVTHNIHVMGQSNRDWNHSQGAGDPDMHHKFTRAEIMAPIKCNIHDWMHAYIGVVDHPYFMTTGADGTFSLPNLPPGRYTVTAWHEGLGTVAQDITIANGEHATLALAFGPENHWAHSPVTSHGL